MKLSAGLLVATTALSVSAAPSPASHQWALDALSPATGLTNRLASSISSILYPFPSIWQGASSAEDELKAGDHSDKSIYDVITTNEYFTQLAKAVNYSSDSTKDLLKGKTGEKLTLFAPVNVHRRGHHDGSDHGHEDGLSLNSHAAGGLAHSTASWRMIEQQIADYEASAFHGQDDSQHDDDDDKERRRRRLAHVIDGVLRYHLVHSAEPIDAKKLVDNSTVASRLSIHGKAIEYVSKLNDGLPLRIRVGKSLLPKPGVYLNFYSKVVYPDVHLSNGILHAVQYPLFQFPSILQGLFSAQPEFSTLTTAFLKTEAEGYLALPVPSKFAHHNDSANAHHHEGHRLPHNGRRGLTDPKGSYASTLFAPSNLAWDRLPWGLRAYLFSPWGIETLGKILMLHSIPNDIVYADSVHHVHRHKDGEDHIQVAGVTVSYDEPRILAKLWADNPLPAGHGRVNVTRYTVDSVLPKLGDGDDLPPPDKAKEFEQVDVEVWRYYLFPNNRGPLQTAIRVQGVPVVVPDVVNLNGAGHLLTRFIRPKGHPHAGVWAQAAQEAEMFGFGTIDLEAQDW